MSDFNVGDLVYAREKTYHPESWKDFLEKCPDQKCKVYFIFNLYIICITTLSGSTNYNFNPSDLIKVSCETCKNNHHETCRIVIYTTCDQSNNYQYWQPKKDGPTFNRKDQFCSNCKFEKLLGHQRPCKTCVLNRPMGRNWQPKEQEKNMAIDSNGNISPYVCGTASTEQPKEAPIKYELIKEIPIWEFMQKTYEDHRRINMGCFHADINHWFGCGAIIKEINDIIHDAVWSSYFLPKLIQYGYIREVEEEMYKVGDEFKNADFGYIYALSLIDDNHAVKLLCSDHQSYWGSGSIKVNDFNNITKDEFNQICKGKADRFTKL